MKSVKIIDPKSFLKESEKVVQIVRQNQERLRKELSPEQRLEIVEELLTKVKDVQEYKMLKEKKDELEIEIRLDTGEYDAIPKEKRELVLRNRNVEELEINEQLKEYQQQVEDLCIVIENQLIPLLANIEVLERRKLILSDVDLMLDGKITRRNTGFSGSVVDFARRLHFSNEYTQAKTTKKTLEETLKELRKIKVPKKNNFLSKLTGKGANQ